MLQGLRNSEYQANTQWIRHAKSRIRLCVREERHSEMTDSRVPRRSNLERISLPHFSGHPEDWAEFKRIFDELTKAEEYSLALLLAQLRTRLPKEALQLIAGVQEVKEAWKRLAGRYGDKKLAIITVKKKLRAMNPTKGPTHERVLQVTQTVRQATTTLRAVGALETLSCDVEMIGSIIKSFSKSHQERWNMKVAEDATEDLQAEWDRFEKWLMLEENAAISARLMHLGTEGHTANHMQQPTPPCGKCGKGGHKTIDCVHPPTLSNVHASQVYGAGTGRLSSPQAAEEVRKADEEKFGPCPLCHKNIPTAACLFGGRWSGPHSG